MTVETLQASDTPVEPATDASGRDFDSLEARFERHTLMTALATRFISVPTDQIPAAVEDAMSAIGRYAGVDRVALVMFDDKYERWSIEHDWHAPGLWSLKGLVEHVSPFRWGLPQIIAGSPVEVIRPDLLPRLAANEALLLRGLGLGAAILLPVYRKERVIGFASMSTTRPRTNAWPKALYELLELPARMMVHALDRTGAEQRLRESQARWKSLCDSNVVGVLSMRRSDGTIVDANEAALRLLGRTRDDLADGIPWKETTPKEERKNDTRMLGILERTGRVMPWERQVERPDGSKVPVLCSLTSLAPQSDEMLSVAIDLSSRQRLTDELRRRDDIDRLHGELSRRLLTLAAEKIEEAVVEALGDVARRFQFDGVVIFDVDANVETASRRAWWSRESIRQTPEARISLADRPWWRERLRAGRTTYLADIETLPENASGERAAMERFGLQSCISVPLLPGGTMRGFILFFCTRRMSIADDLLATLRVFGDIVANALERRRLDQEIAGAAATMEWRVELRRTQLEASNAELEAFAYSVSHDLRAPLRTIDGMSQVLREDFAGELREDAIRLLARIQVATRRMAHLIDGLLQLSRVVRTSMVWNEVTVSDIAEGIADDLRRRDPERNVVVKIAPDIRITGHPNLIAIALTQLLDNAFKFTALREQAIIELDATARDGQTLVCVRDNGVGFDPEFAEKLFGAFQRLHNMEEFEGHGIGLAMVERVVRMHDGKAWADGVPDKGATIWLSFPHRPHGSNGPHGSAGTHAAGPHAKARP
ncbi:MAG TPA: ATP-binding protein [Candidatus Limnocylindrales bacterium]|nr:ATP-binding protein [Candidatus Limnocylindrales bacterium]